MLDFENPLYSKIVDRGNKTMSYTDTHDPLYAYIDLDFLGPVWTVVWVWSEKQFPGGPLTRRCPHRHHDYDQAVACARATYPALGEIRTK